MSAAQAGSAVQMNDKSRIVFFGDSITANGADHALGFVRLIQSSVKSKYPDAEIIGAGQSGNTVVDLQRRVTRNVLKKKPSVVVIYIGTNDVWHQSWGWELPPVLTRAS